MGKSAFRFKQFEVRQEKCAVKINTDGVLLGAWADVSAAKQILDIGTGTGVIALMMAQRCDAEIHAIDIDEGAYNQAKENFEQSVWAERLSAFHTSLQQFNSAAVYDVIISNPPYFIDDMKTANHRRNVAKHSVMLSYEELLAGISRLLSQQGKALVVLPVFNLSIFETLARKYELFITVLTEVSAVEGRAPYLLMIQIERGEKNLLKNNLAIQNVSGIFSEAYKILTKDFYLKF